MRRAIRALVALGLFILGGCSLWVSAEPEEIGCSEEGRLGPPACGVDFICARGGCIRCASRDICGDGIDNDCNGRIDDGCPGTSTGGAPNTHNPALPSGGSVAKSAAEAGAN
ncbi:MAG TPA: hypothetical protein VGM44_16220 [Polyangiaceae bacterium]|jgi:hypothetical protein